MSDPSIPPQPTERDRENAAIRQAIADRQAAEFAEAQALADATLGPGWHPWMRLTPIDSDHHRTGNTQAIATAYRVHRGEQRLSENSTFLSRMPDGQVMRADNYEALFGDLLHEPHPTRRFEVKGKTVAAPRWTLCWSALERYEPKSAEELAALRVARERGKAERQERKWREENPLLAWAEQAKQEEEGKSR